MRQSRFRSTNRLAVTEAAIQGLIEAFLLSIETGEPSRTAGPTSFESHLLAFSAEKARISGTVLDIASLRATASVELA